MLGLIIGFYVALFVLVGANKSSFDGTHVLISLLIFMWFGERIEYWFRYYTNGDE